MQHAKVIEFKSPRLSRSEIYDNDELLYEYQRVREEQVRIASPISDAYWARHSEAVVRALVWGCEDSDMRVVLEKGAPLLLLGDDGGQRHCWYDGKRSLEPAADRLGVREAFERAWAALETD